MAISLRWVVLAVLAAVVAVAVVLMVGSGQDGGATMFEPIVSYEELTRIIGPVQI